MAGNKSFAPVVPASSNIAEITPRAIVLGIILGVVLGAANVYLGLYAGMTVSASIPAAVVSMGILRGLMRNGTILENNIVQTMASTSESLAAGIIFTVPALVIAGVWTEYNYWQATLIAIAGGLLGVLFMIPLRKPHVVEDESLTFPEGVACAEVLKTGEKGGSGALYLLWSVIIGALLKFLTTGTTLLKGSVEWVWSAGKTGLYFGTDISAALLGVGYIIGFRIAVLVFLGGAIGWMIALPIMGAQSGIEGDLMDWFWTGWSTKVRYMGVGAMVVGGIWSVISIWDGIKRGFQEAIVGYKAAAHRGKEVLRTEVNMEQKHLIALLGLAVLIGFSVYYWVIGSFAVSAVSAVMMVVLSFFLVAVASYIVGLVGSSSSPVSGMTICAVLATGFILLLMGLTGTSGIIATLAVAGVVCCATCTSGDISQDLKTGHIVGATPRKQQWMEVIAVLIPSLALVPVLVILHSSYGIGTGEPGALKAPQATLFANLVKALFGQGELPWNYAFIGGGVGIAIIIADQILKNAGAKFRMPVMAVAVGIYLPLTLSIPLLLGGFIAAKVAQSRGDSSESDPGTLFASGLIAGEALLGVVLGGVIYVAKDSLPIAIGSAGAATTLSVVMFLALAGGLYWVGTKKEA